METGDWQAGRQAGTDRLSPNVLVHSHTIQSTSSTQPGDGEGGGVLAQTVTSCMRKQDRYKSHAG
jgi:hypothetical protein